MLVLKETRLWPRSAASAQLGMISPVGQRPAAEFHDGNVLTAWLHVTNACNLRCPYCYLDKSSAKMDEATGIAAIEAVISSALKHGFPAVKLKYAGGEASLNQQLVLQMQAHAEGLARRHGLRLYATLLSNGVMLPASPASVLKDKGIGVMISLDGVDAAHDIQRPFVSGKPTFKHVEKTIAQLMALEHPPHLSITVTNLNAPYLAEVGAIRP